MKWRIHKVLLMIMLGQSSVSAYLSFPSKI
jgi:hypothetical protein